MIREWERTVKKFSHRWDDEDEAFDAALDIVMSHNDAPMEEGEDEEIDVELAREWAYQLMKHVGKPYGGKHWRAATEEEPTGDPGRREVLSSLQKRAEKTALQKEAKLSLRAQATSNPPGIAVYVTVPPFIGDIKKLNDRVLDQLYDVVEKAVEKASGSGSTKMTHAIFPGDIDALELDVASGKGLHIMVHFSEIELTDLSKRTITTPGMAVLRDAAKGIRQ
jgi:hypothetical protein